MKGNLIQTRANPYILKILENYLQAFIPVKLAITSSDRLVPRVGDNLWLVHINGKHLVSGLKTPAIEVGDEEEEPVDEEKAVTKKVKKVKAERASTPTAQAVGVPATPGPDNASMFVGA